MDTQPSNKGKKQKTVAPISGQSSLDFFMKRKSTAEPPAEPKKAQELQSVITNTTLKRPSLDDFNDYQKWIKDKDVKVVDPNPEHATPEKQHKSKQKS